MVIEISVAISLPIRVSTVHEVRPLRGVVGLVKLLTMHHGIIDVKVIGLSPAIGLFVGGMVVQAI